ncbi:MAG: hypothetical protein VYC27_05930 [Candidatus Thermoplasmatota archaeon]|nr:hypothetical protein [Candidatus Thermoplasmatota archaeon]
MTTLRAPRSRAVLLMGMMVLALLPMTLLASAADIDGDGVEDANDACPYAYGTSTVDRDGCPDTDGDGTSDLNDGWTISNPNFTNVQTISSSNEYFDVDYSPDGTHVVTAASDGFVRVWNATTHTNVRSANAISGGEVTSVDWSPDGQYIAAGLDDDTMQIYYASNLTSVHGTISVDVGGGDYVYDVTFNPDSDLVAVSIGRSGNGGTNGQVFLIQVSDGSNLHSLNPNSEDRFYASAFSPDGQFIALAGNGDFYVANVTSQQTMSSVSSPPAAINNIAWSPDGNYIAMCGGWEGSSASVDMYEYTGSSWSVAWGFQTTTSCASVEFSPDGRHIAAGLYWYGADAVTTYIAETTTGAAIDNFSGPRPGGCTGFGGSNNCGIIYGLSWSPDSTHLVTAHGRGDEGVYFWYADIDEDNDGYNSTDQGDGIVDAFPSDGSQWDDSDGDGYGDNPAPATQPDACVNTAGTSNMDRFGCLDTDGDGYSDPDAGWTILDGADVWPGNPEQWADADQDGHGDNYLYDINQTNQLHINQRGDAFPLDPQQWNDTDGDGYGDNYDDPAWTANRAPHWPGERLEGATMPDAFPLDRTQWSDNDGDGIGDNPNSGTSDGCPNVAGDSFWDRLGCPDSDGDGWSDPTDDWGPNGECTGADAFKDDPTQWCDSDGDGYGDNESGNQPDACPNQAGTSDGDVFGCADRDGDGWSNAGEPFPDDGTQWADRDGDNRGDNPDGNNADLYPDDSSQWADSDGDGYGDNPSGTNGDRFPNDALQWEDTDGDGFGDNFVDEDGDGVSESGDVCPTLAGSSKAPLSRGCPDSDADGYMDNVDAFPANPFQWNDTDGDGYGDNNAVSGGDSCVNEYGRSNQSGRLGCPDADFDGWADDIDVFPDDGLQWVDSDGDGYGDNYVYEVVSVEDEDNPGMFLMLREEQGDAFPNDVTQWSDRDGDGRGDNPTGNLPDAFPLRVSQQLDFDGDGYGDNITLDAYQSDGCRKIFGTSTDDTYGCPDADDDGTSDDADPCPYDPSIEVGVRGQVTCTITAPQDNGDGDASLGGGDIGAQVDTLTLVLVGVVGLMLAAVALAMIARNAGRKAALSARENEKLSNAAFNEEEERRQEWINYYVGQGQLDEARALGWTGQGAAAPVPQWQQYEQQQAEAERSSMPSMPDLDQL